MRRKITTFLTFDGRAEEAVDFYTSIFPDSRVTSTRRWQQLSADGGEPGPCGWLTDKFGVSWQVIPRALGELLGDPEPERSQRVLKAMLKMGKIEVAELQRAYEGT